MQQTVGRETSSYRQGVVLGLTMAETMLLLVFCLLFASAAVFARERQMQDQLRDDIANTNAELAGLREENARLRGFANPEIPDDWQHLVPWRPAIDELEGAGLSVSEVVDAVPVFVRLVEHNNGGVSADVIDAGVQITQIITGSLPDEVRNTIKPERYPDLIQGGIEAEKRAKNDQSKGKHNWPPIITLSEADKHFFKTGSAELSPAFRDHISHKVVKDLLGHIREYDVNVIEVIGHTDAQPFIDRPSNLDKLLIPVLHAKAAVGTLVPADNAGLGLARAVSVARVLLKDKGLTALSILPYSGGQLIEVGDGLSDGASGGDVRQRRRIEIRLHRSDAIRAGEGTSTAGK